MKRTPALSVVMPVHNAADTLDEAIGSILGQTFTDFEFVILNDGSTDGSADILSRWAQTDTRIRLIKNEMRSGAANSSNRVTQAAISPLIARMDADDIAEPERLERQIRILNDHPDTVLVGALFETIDDRSRRVRPADYGRLFRPSVFAPFCHSTVILRKEAFDQVGGYRDAAEKWEDVDLYLRLARNGRIRVLPEPLIRYRQTGFSTRSADGEAALEDAMALMYRCVRESAEGRDYDPLMSKRQGTPIDPRILVECGSSAVWAGRRPRMFRRALQRAAIAPSPTALSVLLWAAWGDFSPRTLRAALRLRLAIGSRSAQNRVSDGQAVIWSPFRE